MHIGRSRHKARSRHKYSSQKAHSLPINLGRPSCKGYATFDFSQSHRKKNLILRMQKMQEYK